MKKLQTLLLAIAAIAFCSLPASAQFRIGPRLGMEVNSMRLNSSIFDNDNRAGFTGGVQAEFTIPVVNVAFDLSLMYVHRVGQSNFKNDNGNLNADDEALLNSKSFKKRDYIEIPLNFKYKIGLPLVGKIVTPYIFTGPSFAFLASKRAITEAYENKAFDVAWNFGLGLQLFTHLQVGASYGLGITKTVNRLNTGITAPSTPIEGKNNYWTVTAAWLF
ncbi:MAG: PorT family protein [Bacteroidales bacterium]|nr:PorT family protein [Bacteroidales bacterium]